MAVPFRLFPQTEISQQWNERARTIVRNAMSGKLNIVETLTLTANAASTTLTDELIDEASQIVLTPETANAAAALATTYIPRANITTGQAIIVHASNAQVDKTFTYAILG